MSDKQAERWARQRRGGRLRFILLRGVLGWGVVAALLAAAFDPWWGTSRTFAEALGINLIGFPIAGIWVGAMTWAQRERQYQRWQQSDGMRPSRAS